MNQTLGQLFSLNDGKKNIVSVVGCNGKTSLIYSLAKEFSKKKVLITTSTHILPLPNGIGTNIDFPILHKPLQPGIYCMGSVVENEKKISALPRHVFLNIMDYFDIIFIEADGSRGKPVKAWLTSEPVIIPETTHTIGVLTFNALGRFATDENVHRLEPFLQLLSMKKNDVIQMNHLMKLIMHPNGLFQHQIGKKILFLNGNHKQLLEENATALTKQLLSNNFFCNRIIYGSSQKNVGVLLHSHAQ